MALPQVKREQHPKRFAIPITSQHPTQSRIAIPIPHGGRMLKQNASEGVATKPIDAITIINATDNTRIRDILPFNTRKYIILFTLSIFTLSIFTLSIHSSLFYSPIVPSIRFLRNRGNNCRMMGSVHSRSRCLRKRDVSTGDSSVGFTNSILLRSTSPYLSTSLLQYPFILSSMSIFVHHPP